MNTLKEIAESVCLKSFENASEAFKSNSNADGWNNLELAMWALQGVRQIKESELEREFNSVVWHQLPKAIGNYWKAKANI